MVKIDASASLSVKAESNSCIFDAGGEKFTGLSFEVVSVVFADTSGSICVREGVSPAGCANSCNEDGINITDASIVFPDLMIFADNAFVPQNVSVVGAANRSSHTSVGAFRPHAVQTIDGDSYCLNNNHRVGNCIHSAEIVKSNCRNSAFQSKAENAGLEDDVADLNLLDVG